MKTKKLLLLSALTLLSLSSAFGKDATPKLPIDSITNKITYSEIVSVDSLSNKQELFSRAREWFAKTFNSATNVIQMEDKESGKIVGKALMQVYRKSALGNMEHGYVNYTIAIYVKDGRYKYVVTDFHHTGQLISAGIKIPDYGACEGMINYKPTFWDPVAIKSIISSILSQLDNNSINLVQNLKSAMTTKTTNTKNENW